MFKKIPKPFPFFDNQDKKRPISAPRAQNGDMKFINGSIKLSQASKLKQDKNQIPHKPNMNFNSKGKKGFNPQLKIEGTLFKPNKQIGIGAKLNLIPHSPFDIKSRNNNISKKNNHGQQHHSGTYKGNIQLIANAKPGNKKDSFLSPQMNNDKGDKTPERSNLKNTSMLTAKFTHSPHAFAKIGHNNNKNAKRKPISNPYPIKVTKAFRSITPIIRPKYSTASIKPKNRNITPTQNDLRNNNPFYQTTKSQYGFRNHQLSFNEELNKSMKIINHKQVKTTTASTSNSMNLSMKKLHNFRSKNTFSYPAKQNIPPKPKSAQKEGENTHNNNNQGDMIINVNINQQIINSNNNNKSTDIKKELSFNSKLNGNKVTDNEALNPTEIIYDKRQQVKSQPNLFMKKELISIVNKKIKRMHEFSKTGYAGEDEKKVNQDNYFVFRNFVNSSENMFMAVCDGHGAVGQEVSGFIKENLPNDLNKVIQLSKRNINEDNIHDLITDTFNKINDKLITNEMINSMLSGSTCVSVIYTPKKLITANVGDSRAILGKCSKGVWKSMDITRDHKPSEEDEKKRILEKGGRVEPMKDEDDGSFIGPPRVWVQDEEYPGLAMSRSFGDRVAHSLGVTAEPEIKEYKFEEEDRFFVVASDGLFEFISSQEIVNIVKEYYINDDIVGCCEYLYKLSSEKWIKEEEVIDDITLILVFLDEE